MSIVTLISDWNSEDYYSVVVKANILSKVADCRVIDITHKVPFFSLQYASFIIRNSYRLFPEGTIHLICVRSERTEQMPHLLVSENKQYFISADNGIFTLIFDKIPDKIVRINQLRYSDDEITSFPELTVFSNVAIDLLKSAMPEDIGLVTNHLNQRMPFLPAIEESRIYGTVLFIDSYRNVVTNINREIFERIRRGRRFTIFVNNEFRRIKKLNSSYLETPEGELLALFNSAGLLEIAICQGMLAELLQLDTSSKIRVDFYD